MTAIREGRISVLPFFFLHLRNRQRRFFLLAFFSLAGFKKPVHRSSRSDIIARPFGDRKSFALQPVKDFRGFYISTDKQKPAASIALRRSHLPVSIHPGVPPVSE
jgi:hypothetical protein